MATAEQRDRAKSFLKKAEDGQRRIVGGERGCHGLGVSHRRPAQVGERLGRQRRVGHDRHLVAHVDVHRPPVHLDHPPGAGLGLQPVLEPERLLKQQQQQAGDDRADRGLQREAQHEGGDAPAQRAGRSRRPPDMENSTASPAAISTIRPMWTKIDGIRPRQDSCSALRNSAVFNADRMKINSRVDDAGGKADHHHHGPDEPGLADHLVHASAPVSRHTCCSPALVEMVPASTKATASRALS